MSGFSIIEGSLAIRKHYAEVFIAISLPGKKKRMNFGICFFSA